MTDEDLQAIRGVVLEVVSAAEERLRGDTVTTEERLRGDIVTLGAQLRLEIAAAEERLSAKQDRAVEMIAGELSRLREEMNQRFEYVDKRFNMVERRLERVEYQTIGMSKSLTDAERLDTEIAAALGAQQKSIGDLYNQLAEIRRFRPPQ